MGCEKLKKCVTLHFFIPNICRNKNFIYLCTRKRKQCNNAEVAQLVEHNLAKVRVAGSSPVFRSSLKRKGCSNGGIGRHEGLKILWPLRLCGFKSRFEYTSLSKQSPVFRSSLKRKGCSNGGIGRHEGLKILWPLRLCGFKSRFEYTSLSKHILRK